MTNYRIVDDFNGFGPISGTSPNIWTPKRPSDSLLDLGIYFGWDGDGGLAVPVDNWSAEKMFKFGGRAYSIDSTAGSPFGSSSYMYLPGASFQALGVEKIWRKLLSVLPPDGSGAGEELIPELIRTLGQNKIDLGPSECSLYLNDVEFEGIPAVGALGLWPSTTLAGVDFYIDGDYYADYNPLAFDPDEDDDIPVSSNRYSDGIFMLRHVHILEKFNIFDFLYQETFRQTDILEAYYVSRSPVLPSSMSGFNMIGPYSSNLVRDAEVGFFGRIPFTDVLDDHYAWYGTKVLSSAYTNPDLSRIGMSCDNGRITVTTAFPSDPNIVNVDNSYRLGSWTGFENTPSGADFPLGIDSAMMSFGNLFPALTHDFSVLDFSNLNIPRTPGAQYRFKKVHSITPTVLGRGSDEALLVSFDNIEVEFKAGGSGGWRVGSIPGQGSGSSLGGYFGFYLAALIIDYAAVGIPK